MEKIKKLCVCSFYITIKLTLNTEMYLFIYKNFSLNLIWQEIEYGLLLTNTLSSVRTAQTLVKFNLINSIFKKIYLYMF